jgi:hypothetical protein
VHEGKELEVEDVKEGGEVGVGVAIETTSGFENSTVGIAIVKSIVDAMM